MLEPNISFLISFKTLIGLTIQNFNQRNLTTEIFWNFCSVFRWGVISAFHVPVDKHHFCAQQTALRPRDLKLNEPRSPIGWDVHACGAVCVLRGTVACVPYNYQYTTVLLATLVSVQPLSVEWLAPHFGDLINTSDWQSPPLVFLLLFLEILIIWNKQHSYFT